MLMPRMTVRVVDVREADTWRRDIAWRVKGYLGTDWLSGMLGDDLKLCQIVQDFLVGTSLASDVMTYQNEIRYRAL